ncbi:ABC transporter permease subunit [Pseudophaeobacter arcticus]|uniref:ABC transporter permease subunit n=1 Tax=Pseudophaeobacter arcticus TaxID=385492 RepID=UPI003A972FCF
MTSGQRDPQALLREIHRGFRGNLGDAYRTATASLSFDTLYHGALALAERLLTLPSGPTPRPVLIWGHKDPRYMIAYWACLLAGRPLVPTERDTPPERLRQIVQGCDACAVLVAEGDPADFTHVSGALQNLELPIWGVDPTLMPAAEAITAPPVTSEDFVQSIRTMLMPSFVLGTALAATMMRHTRSAMLGVLSADYVRTARAKGLNERSVVLKHAFRNALTPIVTLTALLFGELVAGAVLTEQIFTIPGFGKMVVDAVFNRDYAVVQGIVLVTAVGFIFMNLVADALYFILNPRLRGQ